MTGVIADDLTGAAEIGAVGSRHGLRAEVVLSGEPSGKADLVCLDTDSRLCAPGEAAERAACAARWLRQQRTDWVYKKTDSVLRGNVTPELEAIVTELGLDGALLVPANPALGRTIAGGRYFVRGQLLHETEFARDPKHPRVSSEVRELIAAPAKLPLLVRRAEEGLPERGIVIGEVSSADDLRQWAALRNARWLMAGGADFFGALLAPQTTRLRSQDAGERAVLPLLRRGEDGRNHPTSNIHRSTSDAPLALTLSPSEGGRECTCRPGRQLFVCGSGSDVTRAFVASQVEQGVPAFSLPQELASGSELSPASRRQLEDQVIAACTSTTRVVIHVGLSPLKRVAVAESLALHLVSVARAVLHGLPIGHVFAEGGATAVALARQMGWSRLRVTAALAPGVVTLSPQDGSSMLFTMKPGTYLWPQTLARLPLR